MHRIIKKWLAPALLAGLIVVGAGLAQPPIPPPQEEGRGVRGPSTDPAQPPPVSVEDIVERIMAFDKNKDGKITKDELPERMHHLIELGDTNKDGALDKDEIRKLATKLAATPGGFGVGGGGRVGGGRGPGGFGFGGQVRGSFGPGPGSGAIEGVVDDLKLSGKKKEQALAAVKAHEEHVRNLMEQARAELLAKMKGILSEEELKDFSAALDRPRGITTFIAGPRDTPQGGGQQKLDRPQK